MRQFSQQFANHLASGATTLCWCWAILRTDGTELGFTRHDLPIWCDGRRFGPAHGLGGGETARRLGPKNETAELLGVLQSDAITEDDIALGR